MHMLLAAAFAVDPPLQAANTVVPAGDDDVQVGLVACPTGYVALNGSATIYGQITGVAVASLAPGDNWVMPETWQGIVVRDPSYRGTMWGTSVAVTCLRSDLDAALVRAQVDASVQQGSVGAIEALCPQGTSVLSGASELSGEIEGWALSASAPVGTRGWRAEVSPINPAAPTSSSVDITVGAWCMPNALWRRHVRVLSAANTGTATPSATVLCPAGSFVISGGARVETAPAGVAMARGARGLVLTSMGPNNPAGLADAWNVTSQEAAPPGFPWGVRAVAFCFTP
jgi:hypothetical protein